MPFEVTNNINSALISGLNGLRNSAQGITESALNIAQNNAQAKDPKSLLADVATQQIGAVKDILPQGGDQLTQDILSLSVNSINAQASAKVIGVASDTVGRIIDELA